MEAHASMDNLLTHLQDPLIVPNLAGVPPLHPGVQFDNNGLSSPVNLTSPASTVHLPLSSLPAPPIHLLGTDLPSPNGHKRSAEGTHSEDKKRKAKKSKSVTVDAQGIIPPIAMAELSMAGTPNPAFPPLLVPSNTSLPLPSINSLQPQQTIGKLDEEEEEESSEDEDEESKDLLIPAPAEPLGTPEEQMMKAIQFLRQPWPSISTSLAKKYMVNFPDELTPMWLLGHATVDPEKAPAMSKILSTRLGPVRRKVIKAIMETHRGTNIKMPRYFVDLIKVDMAHAPYKLLYIQDTKVSKRSGTAAGYTIVRTPWANQVLEYLEKQGMTKARNSTPSPLITPLPSPARHAPVITPRRSSSTHLSAISSADDIDEKLAALEARIDNKLSQIKDQLDQALGPILNLIKLSQQQQTTLPTVP